MKNILLSLLLSIGLYASTSHSSKVLEILNSGGYTYMKVQDQDKSYWIAMTQRAVKIGDTVEYNEQGWMQNFHSKTLNRTFESILFAGDVSKQTHMKSQDVKADKMNSDYPSRGSVSVAKLFKNPEKYVGKSVTVKGKVTKTSVGIMKLNWLHIQDGSSFKNMDDLVFTSTQELPPVGTIIHAKGTLVKDKDFGYGYFYPVIIQKASFKK